VAAVANAFAVSALLQDAVVQCLPLFKAPQVINEVISPGEAFPLRGHQLCAA